MRVVELDRRVWPRSRGSGPWCEATGHRVGHAPGRLRPTIRRELRLFQERDRPDRDPLRSTDEAQAFASLRAGPRRGCHVPSVRRRRRARRPRWPPSSAMCGREPGVARPRSTTSTLPIHQPSCATRAATSASRPIDDASAYAGSDAGNNVTEVGESGRAEQRVGHRVGHDVGVGMADQRRAHRRSPRRRCTRRPSVTERVDVVSDPDPDHEATPRRARTATARSRSAGSVILKLSVAPGTTTTRTSGALDHRGVVGPLGRGRVRGAQHVGAEGLRSLHGHERVARDGRDDRAVRSTCLTVSAIGSPGTAPSAPARTAAITRSNIAVVGHRPGRVVHHARSRSRPGARRARRAPTRIASRHRRR